MRLWTQDEFVARRQAEWSALTAILTSGKPLHKLPAADISRFSALYRGACADLVHARDVGFTPDLVSYLDGLAGRAHNLLYAAPPYRIGAAWDLVAREFPRTLRRNGRFFALGMALFFVPLIACAVATIFFPEFAYQVLSREQLQGMANMYSEAHTGRDEATDSGMAGFYVYNNVGIAFRCFATGLLFGFGSMYFTVFNGLYTGVVLGHLARVGLGERIFSFVSAHSPWELNAIVIACAAGLQMGLSLVRTRGRTRLGNLQAHGLELMRQIIGAALFLGVAAILEGNVSPSTLPPEAKYALGVASAALVFGIVFLSGKNRPLPSDVLELRAAQAPEGRTI